MFQNVDLVGAQAVIKMMEQSKHKRFTIYRQGASKGNTPVFVCNDTDTNLKAIKCFSDWASNITAFNPTSNQCYDILLYDVNEDNDESRRSKVKFSFALTSFNFGQHIAGMQQMQPVQQQTPQVDISAQVAEGIAKGIEMFKKEHQISELLKRIDELENEEEEEEEPDQLGRILELTKQVNLNKHLSLKEKGLKVAGDDDDDDDDLFFEELEDLEEELEEEEEEEEEAPAAQNKNTSNKKMETTNAAFSEQEITHIMESLKVLKKSDRNLYKTLRKLAQLSQKNPQLFKTLLGNLDSLV